MTFPVSIVVPLLNINVDFTQVPPTHETLFKLDGLIEDVPITLTSTAEGFTARGLPDFGRFWFHEVIDEIQNHAGAFRFERAQQEICGIPQPAPGGPGGPTYYY